VPHLIAMCLNLLWELLKNRQIGLRPFIVCKWSHKKHRSHMIKSGINLHACSVQVELGLGPCHLRTGHGTVFWHDPKHGTAQNILGRAGTT
jgi:hypothetical protein